MNRTHTLTAAAVGVVVVALLVAAAVPGVLADPTDDGPVRPGPVRIAEVAISPGEVGGQTAALQVSTRLDHRGNPTSNLTLRVRAVDAESGLVETTRSVDVGTLRGDGETPYNTTLRVEREGGYRFETVVFRDGERVDTGGKRVDGLAALTPDYARTSVAFSGAGGLQPVAFSIAEADAGDNRTRLDVSAALTNAGDDPSEDLRVTVVLRQAESNIVASRAAADVGAIRPGRTETVDTTVTVPRGYNYYIDAVLWKDGVVVDTARSAANLDPTRRINVTETERDVELRVSDFDGNDGRTERPEAEATYTTESSTPGFGPVVALSALLAVALLARRRWSA